VCDTFTCRYLNTNVCTVSILDIVVVPHENKVCAFFFEKKCVEKSIVINLKLVSVVYMRLES